MFGGFGSRTRGAAIAFTGVGSRIWGAITFGGFGSRTWGAIAFMGVGSWMQRIPGVL